MKPLSIKSTVAVFSLAALVILAVSCKDDVLVPVNDTTQADSTIILINKLDAQNVTVNAKDNTIRIKLASLQNTIDSLNNASDDNPRKIEYTVYLVNAGNTITSTANGGRIKGVDGATVTVFAGGKTYTATSADGRAVFEGLGGGSATVQISATGFASVSYQTYFFSDNRSSFGDGAVRVASTHVLVFPTGGSDIVTVTGQLYANKSTLDDTLGRQYLKVNDATRYLKFISAPGISDFPNYTQNTDHDFAPFNNNTNNFNNLNPYGVFADGTGVKYDPLLSLNGANIFAYPDGFGSIFFTDDVDFAVPGQLLSITYTGLVSTATVDGSGKYTLKVSPYENFPGVRVNVEHYTDDHTYLTAQNNVGSTPVTIKLIDPQTYVVTPTDFYKITNKWIYRATITDDDGTDSGIPFEIDRDEFYYQSFSENITTGYWLAKPGTSIIRNIYFYPTVPAQ